jgi:cytoskeletal protein CcmA (bactofilin family)
MIEQLAGTGVSVSGLGRHATLGPSLSIQGDIFAQQDLVVRGTVRGNVDLPEHSLTIAPEGRVIGNVFARAVTIGGTCDGAVMATVRVQVFAGATVEAEITTPRLFVEDGALVQGRADTHRTEAAMRVARYRLEKRMANG